MTAQLIAPPVKPAEAPEAPDRALVLAGFVALDRGELVEVYLKPTRPQAERRRIILRLNDRADAGQAVA